MTDKTTETQPTAPAETTAYPKAKKGQDDAGHNVSTANDEPISGTIADITDGDRPHRKHK